MVLDRTGEPVDTDPPEPELEPPHDPRCRNGWIDRDADKPVACTDCKPWLKPDRLRAKAHGPYDPYEPPKEAS
jgi:hypothetical protein